MQPARSAAKVMFCAYGLLIGAIAIASETMVAKLTAPESGEVAVQELKPVGSATLSVFIWEIYESHLYTPTGTFEQVGPGTALKIQYKRDITSEQLVKTTKSEWQKLSLYESESSDPWLQKLRALWPDINKADELLLYVDDQLNSHFYLNNKFIGTLQDAQFTQQFLAIWLSPDTSRPRVRERLLNIGSSTALPPRTIANHS